MLHPHLHLGCSWQQLLLSLHVHSVRAIRRPLEQLLTAVTPPFCRNLRGQLCSWAESSPLCTSRGSESEPDSVNQAGLATRRSEDPDPELASKAATQEEANALVC